MFVLELLSTLTVLTDIGGIERSDTGLKVRLHIADGVRLLVPAVSSGELPICRYNAVGIDRSSKQVNKRTNVGRLE